MPFLAPCSFASDALMVDLSKSGIRNTDRVACHRRASCASLPSLGRVAQAAGSRPHKDTSLYLLGLPVNRETYVPDVDMCLSAPS